VFVAGDALQTTVLIFDFSTQVSYTKLNTSQAALKFQLDQGLSLSSFSFEGPIYTQFLDLVDNAFDIAFTNCLTG